MESIRLFLTCYAHCPVPASSCLLAPRQHRPPAPPSSLALSSLVPQCRLAAWPMRAPLGRSALSTGLVGGGTAGAMPLSADARCHHAPMSTLMCYRRALLSSCCLRRALARRLRLVTVCHPAARHLCPALPGARPRTAFALPWCRAANA